VKPHVSLSLLVFLTLTLTGSAMTGCTSSSSSPADATVDSAGDGAPPNECMLAGFVCQTSCPSGAINVQDLNCLHGQLCCLLDGGLIGSDAAFDAGHFPDAEPDSPITHDAGGDASHVDGGHDGGHDAGSTDAPHDAPSDHHVADGPSDAPRG
jgi:hypothetical protein